MCSLKMCVRKVHKSTVKFNKKLLKDIQSDLFDRARDFRDSNTHRVKDYNEFKSVISRGGFVRCGWNGNPETEASIKEETKATIRCIPLNNNLEEGSCIYSGNPSNQKVLFAKAY